MTASLRLFSGFCRPLHEFSADFYGDFNMNKISETLLTTTIGLTLLAGANFANAQSLLPPVQHSGANTFITGGIGLDESTAFKSAMKDWPLTLQFAEKSGHKAQYVADVQVVVTDTKGQVVMNAKSEGPFILAKIPPGVYKVQAILLGKAMHQKIELKDGQPAKVTFLWPASNAEAH